VATAAALVGAGVAGRVAGARAAGARAAGWAVGCMQRKRQDGAAAGGRLSSQAAPLPWVVHIQSDIRHACV
jgi:hypothetical protein